MRISVVSALAGSAVAVATVGAVAATAGHLPHQYKAVVVRTGHKTCKKTVINGINDKGTAIGTEFCGKPSAFLRFKSGRIKPVKMPKSDGSLVQASYISSNDTLVVAAAHKYRGQWISYLVSASGVTAVADPAAFQYSTFVDSVNRHGVAVGDYCLNRKCTARRSFVFHHGQYRDFKLHRKNSVLASLSTIADDGSLTGFFYQEPVGYLRGFVKHGHKIRVVDGPKAGHKLGQGTLILGAGNHHAICGDVFGRHRLSAGFVEYRGHMHLVNLHPSQRKSYSELLACNSHGAIGGHSYNPRKHISEGFVAKVG